VAITLVGLAAAAVTPLLVSGLASVLMSRLNTQAKNLAQERIESMRDLQFHVDRQNGPFIDLLDIYYTNLSTTPVTRTRANEIEVGQWVSGGGAAPAPSGPFYQLTISQLPGNPTFSQTIDTQFLDTKGAALPVSALTGYDSQTEGKDQPASPIVGVTVTTTWGLHGKTHSYTTYTRITDTRGLASSLTSQANGEYLRATSTGSNGNALTVDLAVSTATGGLSTGSLATADVHALRARDDGGASFEGATAVATSPSGGSSQNSPLQAFTSAGSGSCGWVGVGPTQVSDVTAGTDAGLPLVPKDVGSTTPPAHAIAAQVTSGSNGACGIFGFSNQSTSYSSDLMLNAATPLVRVDNDSQNNVVVNSTAWLTATALSPSTPHSVFSGATAGSTKRLQIFPGASFVTDGLGLVGIRLSQASLTCSSTSANGSTTSTATGSWAITVDYWHATDAFGHGARATLGTYTWDSATDTGSTDPLRAVDPSTIVVYQSGTTILRLSDYLASWSTARTILENPNSGLHQLTSIVSITTKAVRSGDLLSGIRLELGNLSCAADDNR
jgi:hypothetical protein